MINNKKNMGLIELFKSKGLLFPTSSEEIIEFENNNNINSESPENWDNPISIITQGARKLKNLDLLHNPHEEMEDLKMVARNGDNKLSKEIIEKMYKKHNNSDDTK